MDIGADYIATGHYARIEKMSNGRYAIRNSVTAAKDQTYALYNLTQYQLEHTLMPVGEYTKDEIRNIAKDIGLYVANKPDSMEICFVPDNDYSSFITKNTDKKVEIGNFVDKNGNILGKHRGITNYTIGQRKGLNLSMGHPVFVSEIRPNTNEVVIGENSDIMKMCLVADNVNYMAEENIDENKLYIAKIRYNHKGTPCHVKKIDDKIECYFTEPVRAVTPGQAVVVYDGEYVAFGGTILRGKD
jgi:tRNA-specific 2-thiouridylase